MESFTTLGNVYAQSTLHKVAYSALPDAPVQPYIEPRRRLRRLIGAIRHPIAIVNKKTPSKMKTTREKF